MSDKNLDTASNENRAQRCRERLRRSLNRPGPDEPEKAEITVPDAEPLYQEIRIENKLKAEDGEEVRLKPGASVDVTIEADAKDTEKNE